MFFNIERNQDLAAVDVQNQVKLAEPQLPQEVRQNGITVKKSQKDILLMIAVRSDDPRYDAEYLSNFLKINVEDELKKLNGVGDATVYGQLEFSMLHPARPGPDGAAQVSVAEIVAAVREQNTTNPGGRVGREPAPPGTDLTLSVTTKGRLTDAEGVRADHHPGQPGRQPAARRRHRLRASRRPQLRPAGPAQWQGRPRSSRCTSGRAPTRSMCARRSRTGWRNSAGSSPRASRPTSCYDTTPFIAASIEEVLHTLVEAMLLVTLVVFIFLQSWRTTLIPPLAVPVSIVGTFFGMQMFGFSINSITLFGLVLAIGIVVDDAIVVVENVERIMAERHVSPAQAIDEAMAEVSGALIAIVLVLCAVFVPVGFMGGITGACTSSSRSPSWFRSSSRASWR